MNETWLLDPRDPLVFGNGIHPAAFVPRGPSLPAPATVAGMVRACFVRDPTAVTPEDAHGLLQIHVRGPWLVRSAGDSHVPWVPAPNDGAVGSRGFYRAQLVRLRPGEGVSSGGAVPQHLVHIPTSSNGVKLDPIHKKLPFWPLANVVSWALGGHEVPTCASIPSSSGSELKPLLKEERVHVKIDNTTGTAEPSALFGSSGTRFATDMRLAVEVHGPDNHPAPPSSSVVMGGEARVSFRRVEPEAAFPKFDKFCAGYALAASRPDLLGLRLQLLTPACLHDESDARQPASGPAWMPPVPDPSLTLVAACIPDFEAISGWNLQAAHGRGAPRSVRRLVPAGSVFWYSLNGSSNERASKLLELCERLWAQPIDRRVEATEAEKAEHRNAPACDGYGLTLPGLWFESDFWRDDEHV